MAIQPLKLTEYFPDSNSDYIIQLKKICNAISNVFSWVEGAKVTKADELYFIALRQVLEIYRSLPKNLISDLSKVIIPKNNVNILQKNPVISITFSTINQEEALYVLEYCRDLMSFGITNIMDQRDIGLIYSDVIMDDENSGMNVCTISLKLNLPKNIHTFPAPSE